MWMDVAPLKLCLAESYENCSNGFFAFWNVEISMVNRIQIEVSNEFIAKCSAGEIA